MGLYKLCEHKGRNRDRCEHPWWGSFRGVRVSLSKWANREIRSKAEAGDRATSSKKPHAARQLSTPHPGPDRRCHRHGHALRRDAGAPVCRHQPQRGLITLRGETTKSRKTRVVPVSTTRLRDVFAWLRRDVEGNPKPLEKRVFSNELGEPYRLFHRMWQSIVLKAHGHTPTWSPRLNYQGLSEEPQETFRRINLRWHDLRREYASRLVEHGVPLAQVRDLLGQASITTTERYDNQTLANLQVGAKLERGLAFGRLTPSDLPRGSLTAGQSPAATAVGDEATGKITVGYAPGFRSLPSTGVPMNRPPSWRHFGDGASGRSVGHLQGRILRRVCASHS